MTEPQSLLSEAYHASQQYLTRRKFLKLSASGAAGLLLSACSPKQSLSPLQETAKAYQNQLAQETAQAYQAHPETYATDMSEIQKHPNLWGKTVKLDISWGADLGTTSGQGCIVAQYPNVDILATTKHIVFNLDNPSLKPYSIGVSQPHLTEGVAGSYIALGGNNRLGYSLLTSPHTEIALIFIPHTGKPIENALITPFFTETVPPNNQIYGLGWAGTTRDLQPQGMPITGTTSSIVIPSETLNEFKVPGKNNLFAIVPGTAGGNSGMCYTAGLNDKLLGLHWGHVIMDTVVITPFSELNSANFPQDVIAQEINQVGQWR